MPTTRGAPTATGYSGNQERTAVAMPSRSIFLAASPTDRQQNGQTGTMSTRSTSFRSRAAAIFGTVSSISFSGSRR